MSNNIALILPKLSRFDFDNPTSIDSVVRQLVENSAFKDRHIVFRPPTKNPITSVVTREFTHDTPLWKRRLKKAISSVSPACIEVHQSIYLAHFMARNFRNVPTILFRHNVIDRSGSALRKWKYFKKLENISGFVFVSEFSANHFRSNWPEFEARVHVVPNIVPAKAWFNPVDAKRDQKVIFMGRPIAVKGFKEFCQSMVPVLHNHKDWQAQIFIYEWERHGKYAQPIIEELRRSTKNVEVFVDQPIHEVQRLAKKAQIIVVPSKWDEPFGLVALEAHLAGLAVVSSGRGGLKEVSGDAASYLDQVTPQAISNAVSQLISNASLRGQLQHVGQQRCLDKFNSGKIVKLYDGIRTKLIEAANF
ncbi:MAG: glycosyltransferase family 4 protein [Arenicellales bacterium]|nr:glycosyltransferase family 4 protein [Arenicellales bacterium]